MAVDQLSEQLVDAPTDDSIKLRHITLVINRTTT